MSTRAVRGSRVGLVALIVLAGLLNVDSALAEASRTDWLWLTLDGEPHHTPNPSVAWHGRLMVIAWGVLIPIGVIVARFHKVTANQDWPNALDSQVWWNTHRLFQYAGVFVSLAAVALVFRTEPMTGSLATRLHTIGGWLLLVLGVLQVLGAWLRGSKGGPADINAWPNSPVMPGDHYDMTFRRRAFEAVHSVLGYTSLAITMIVTCLGLYATGAPRWLWLLLIFWWIGLTLRFVQLQRRNNFVRTYQAIWGPSPRHPGNRKATDTHGLRRALIGDRSHNDSV